MKKISFSQILTLIMTVLVIVVNGLANALPINGQNTGEISDKFPIQFVPAGYVFSIWGLIYLLLIVYSIYQLAPSRREDPLLKKIAPAYWLSSAANIVWIFLWHYEVFVGTLIVMLVLLGSLIYIFLQLPQLGRGSSREISFNVGIPFNIYLGWISVATIANIAQVTYSRGWDGWGVPEEYWTMILIVIATSVGLIQLWALRNIPFVAVLVWAFIGIALKNQAVPVVSFSAWFTSGLLVLNAILRPLLENRD